MYLVPRAIYKDPFRGGDNILVSTRQQQHSRGGGWCWRRYGPCPLLLCAPPLLPRAHDTLRRRSRATQGASQRVLMLRACCVTCPVPLLGPCRR